MPTKAKLMWPLGDGFVEEKAYIAEAVKAAKKAHKGADIKDGHVKELIKFAKNGETLDDDQPDAFKAILATVEADYQKAIAHQQEAELAESSKANREVSVLNATLELDKADRNKLNKKFTVGSNFVEIAENATDEEIAQQFAISVVMADFSAWAIGDLANALQDRGLENVIDQFCAQTGRSGSTIYGHMRLARAVVKNDRDPNILPTVYKEIVFPTLSDKPVKDAKIKAKLIEEAVKHNWNSKEARANATEAREVPAEKKGNQPDPIKAAGFLVFKDGEAYLSLDDPGWEDGATIVNIKDRTVLSEIDKPEGGSYIDYVPLIIR